MTLETWIAFVATYSIISLIPGPSVLLAIGQSLSVGKRAALSCVAGDVMGGVVLMVLSFFGLGAILSTSAELFQLVKWAGILYMAYLGLSQIYQARKTDFSEMTVDAKQNSRSFRAGFVTGVLNPKAIIFYVAFLSQFMNPEAAALPQFIILMISSSSVVALVLAGYVFLAEQAKRFLHSATAKRRLNYAGGGFLLGGSLLMASQR